MAAGCRPGAGIPRRIPAPTFSDPRTCPLTWLFTLLLLYCHRLAPCCLFTNVLQSFQVKWVDTPIILALSATLTPSHWVAMWDNSIASASCCGGCAPGAASRIQRRTRVRGVCQSELELRS